MYQASQVLADSLTGTSKHGTSVQPAATRATHNVLNVHLAIKFTRQTFPLNICTPKPAVVGEKVGKCDLTSTLSRKLIHRSNSNQTHQCRQNIWENMSETSAESVLSSYTLSEILKKWNTEVRYVTIWSYLQMNENTGSTSNISVETHRMLSSLYVGQLPNKWVSKTSYNSVQHIKMIQKIC